MTMRSIGCNHFGKIFITRYLIFINFSEIICTIVTSQLAASTERNPKMFVPTHTIHLWTEYTTNGTSPLQLPKDCHNSQSYSFKMKFCWKANNLKAKFTWRCSQPQEKNFLPNKNFPINSSTCRAAKGETCTRFYFFIKIFIIATSTYHAREGVKQAKNRDVRAQILHSTKGHSWIKIEINEEGPTQFCSIFREKKIPLWLRLAY